jgi:hypothetical protein
MIDVTLTALRQVRSAVSVTTITITRVGGGSRGPRQRVAARGDPGQRGAAREDPVSGGGSRGSGSAGGGEKLVAGGDEGAHGQRPE